MAAGPPVEAPIAMMLLPAWPFEVAIARIGEHIFPAGPSLPRMCVITRTRETIFTEETSPRSQTPSGSAPDGFSNTSTAPAANASYVLYNSPRFIEDETTRIGVGQ